MQAESDNLPPCLAEYQQAVRMPSHGKGVEDEACGCLEGLEWLLWDVAGGFVCCLGFAVPVGTVGSDVRVGMGISSDSHDGVYEKGTGGRFPLGKDGVSEVPLVKERREALDAVKEEVNEVEDDVDIDIGLWFGGDRVVHRQGGTACRHKRRCRM